MPGLEFCVLYGWIPQMQKSLTANKNLVLCRGICIYRTKLQPFSRDFKNKFQPSASLSNWSKRFVNAGKMKLSCLDSCSRFIQRSCLSYRYLPDLAWHKVTNGEHSVMFEFVRLLRTNMTPLLIPISKIALQLNLIQGIKQRSTRECQYGKNDRLLLSHQEVLDTFCNALSLNVSD